MKTILKSIDVILKTLSLLGLVAIILCILAAYIPPSKSIIIQYFGLIAPVIIIYNTIISLLWAIRFKLFSVVSIAVITLSLIPAWKLYNIDLMNDIAINKNGLRVATFNVRCFSDKDSISKTKEILSEVKKYNPDIICFQEFFVSKNKKKSIIDKALNGLLYSKVYYTVKQNNTEKRGLSIYSKYPIIDSENIKFENSTNSAMWVDLKIKQDTVRVFNLHLQSNSISESEKSILSDNILIDISNRHQDIAKMNSMRFKISESAIAREKQAKLVSRMIETTPYTTIVCGDLNDVPNSYSYNKIRGKLNDSFMKKGQGYGYSHKDFFSLLRIDYIFTDNEISILNYIVGESSHSDHYPIIVEFKF